MTYQLSWSYASHIMHLIALGTEKNALIAIEQKKKNYILYPQEREKGIFFSKLAFLLLSNPQIFTNKILKKFVNLENSVSI